MQADTSGSVEFYKLGEICQTNSESYSEKENWSEAYYLDTGNITENKIESIQYFDLKNEKLPSRARRKVSDGEIIYSTVRPNQKHYGIIKNPPKHFLVSTGFTTIKTNEEICDSKYVYYYLTQDTIIAHLQALAEQTVSTYPSIKASDIENLDLPLPPLSIQKKIASILSSLDDRIELNTRLNEVLEEIARALFHRWFVKFEFPDAEGRPYKSAGGKMAELESVPEGWRMGTIGDVATRIFSGGTPNTSKSEYWNGEFPWFSSGETRSHFVIFTEKAITKDGVDNSSTKLAKRHDIVIASAGQGFTRGQTSYLLLDTYVNQSVIVISSGDVPSIQTYVYMSVSGRYDELRGISDSSSIRGSLTTKMIGEFPLIIPSPDLIESYAKIVQPIIIQIENNLHENKYLTGIRDTLLPKLMSGELPVPISLTNNTEIGGTK